MFILQKKDEIRHELKSWIFPDIIAPFFITRISLLLIGWFSQYFATGLYYSQEIANRGWEFTQFRLLDIWGRWDTAWYFDIIKNGYYLKGDVNSVQSNIAFFPLYPYIVKFLTSILPIPFTNQSFLLIGSIVSNALFLIALFYLYKLVKLLTHNKKISQLTIWYMLLFPTGFFFSAAYTEAAYLCLTVLSLYKGYKHQWAKAAIFGGLLTLTKSLGGLIVLPLGFEYLRSVDFKISKIKKDILWLFLIPFSFFMFLGNLYPITNDWLAPMKIQNAWVRKLTFPWEALINPIIIKPFLTSIDKAIALLMLTLSGLSFFSLPIELSLYSLILLMMPLTTGSLISISRYYLVIFPLFIVLAKLGNKYKVLDQSIKIIFWTIQVVFFIAWCQFYWLV